MSPVFDGMTDADNEVLIDLDPKNARDSGVSSASSRSIYVYGSNDP